MLMLSRKAGEQIRIGKDIVVVVTAIKGDRVSIGIDASKLVRVLRGELLSKLSTAEEATGTQCEPKEPV